MRNARPSTRPPAPPRPGRLAPVVYWRRRLLLGLIVVTLSYVVYLGVTLAVALGNPALGVSMSARGAEWGREHGFGSVVTWVEARWYSLNPPKKGGSVASGSFGSGPTAVNVPQSGHLPAPARVTSPAPHPMAGEGVWHVVGRTTAKGVPAVYESFIRPDAVHTSYVIGLAWMDPTLLKARLYSGSFIPGPGKYSSSAPIKAADTVGLVSVFNAGFRMQDARGGYYTDGHIVNGLNLRGGAASVIIMKDGTMTVGMWGRDVRRTSQVLAVRQNLDLIVDHGKLVPGLDSTNTKKWGITLGGKFDVWRSGLGVTKTGAIVYAGGPALTIASLADDLRRAGAVRAMELDINTDWVQYSTYKAPLGHEINGGSGTSLLSNMLGTPSQYFTTYWSRDFFTMTLRSKEMKK